MSIIRCRYITADTLNTFNGMLFSQVTEAGGCCSHQCDPACNHTVYVAEELSKGLILSISLVIAVVGMCCYCVLSPPRSRGSSHRPPMVGEKSEHKKRKNVNTNVKLQWEEEQARLNLKWYVYKRATTSGKRKYPVQQAPLTLHDLQLAWCGAGRSHGSNLRGNPLECGILKVIRSSR